jgi:hypothetical protein
MKIYYVGKMKKDCELEKISIRPPTSLAKKLGGKPISDTTLKFITQGMKHSGLFTPKVEECTGLFTRAFSEEGEGIILVTDTQLSNEEFHAIRTALFRHQSSLTEINLEELASPFLSRIINLSPEVDKSALSILLPLKTKLAQEKNSQKKAQAEIMINSMEDALLLLLENKIEYPDVKERIDNAVITAAPVLGKQAGWKKLIDNVVNAIINLFSKNTKNQNSTEKRFSFFANPNRFEEETEQVRKTIRSPREC